MIEKGRVMENQYIMKINRGHLYATRLIRGFFKGFRIKGSNKKVLCGKKVELRNKKHIKINGKINILDYVEIDGLSVNGIIIGDNSTIGKYSIMRASSNYHDLGKGIVIGNNFCCGDRTFFGAAGGIIIGDDVQMGQDIRFHAQNHKFSGKELIRLQGVTSRGITIGNNCWIGSGTVFLDGVCLGDGCVTGANTVITKSFPENSVIVGNPGKLLKQRY